jgi:hypothetical protein
MYCPSCGNEITVELKYCNRCGANLTTTALQTTTVVSQPTKLTVPSIVLGVTVISGLGIIFAGATQFAAFGVHPAAIAWIVLFSAATLFGCTALMIRFLTKLFSMQREMLVAQPETQARPASVGSSNVQQLPPRLEPVPSVTENTTRTFSPIYREPSDRGTR